MWLFTLIAKWRLGTETTRPAEPKIQYLLSDTGQKNLPASELGLEELPPKFVSPTILPLYIHTF